MMFNGLVAIPAEDNRDDAPRSQYATKKDIKWLAVFVIVFAIIGWPIYGAYKKRADSHICASNMNSVYQALSLYAADHDDRFPPLVWEDGSASQGAPMMNAGKVNTWVTSAFEYDPRPEIYHCPAGQPNESVPTEGAIPGKNGEKATHVVIDSNYGMYAGYSAAMKSSIDRSSQTIFLSETSNFGSQQSYDPFPFVDAAGNKIPFDGFSMGWDDNNLSPGLVSRRITRLAFRGSANGEAKNAYGRHDEGLHAITPDGNLLFVHPGDINMVKNGGVPTGRWQVPALIAH